MTNLLSYAIIIDMMKREYEIISHAETNFKVFVVNLLYRAPHIHKDFELGLVLDGNISILLPGQTLLLQPGDFWLINPFQSHEIKAEKPALLLAGLIRLFCSVLSRDRSSGIYILCSVCQC